MKSSTIASLTVLSVIGSLRAETTLLDDFSGDLAPYTGTVILDANGGSSNTSNWEIFGEALELNTSSYDGIEQWAFIRDGLGLAIGQEAQIDLSHSGASQDLGVYVGGTAPSTGIRRDYVTVYARNTGVISSRGFDGTTEYPVAATGTGTSYETLFVARTDSNTFECGYYVDGARTVLATRTPAAPNAATYVGIFADVRDVGYLGSIDAFRVTDIPQLFFSLDTTTFQSGTPSGSPIGTFSSELSGTPTNAAYSLVAGEGDFDNELFAISGNELLVNADFTAAGLDPFDGTPYYVRVEATKDSETTVQQLVLTLEKDDDLDALSDIWEDLYFGDGDGRATPAELALQDGTGDPDNDGLTNEQEETAGSDPTLNHFDTDNDGLFDTFENFYFGDLDEDAGGNTDGDAFDHLAEQNAGSDPTDGNSVPGDIDGNGTPDQNEPIQPYTVDADTLHLWHLDELTPPAADVGSDPVAMTSLDGGGYLWAPSLAGFGTGFHANRTFENGNAGRLSALPLANGAADNTPMILTGAEGAFTFEAIVRLDFDPAATPDSVAPMQIISGDGETNATDRTFQFRILPVGNGEHGGGDMAELEFISLSLNGVGTDVYRVKSPLPGAGAPDAAVQGSWYHVAVAYNGAEGAADNVTLYWTLLDPSRTEASVLGTGQLGEDIDPALTPDFVIGNEGRDLGGTSDGFAGIIDEVRISGIDRGADGFFFVGSGDPFADFVASLPADQRGEADDPDHDGYPNLVEFLFDTSPGSGGVTPTPVSHGSVQSGASLNASYELSLDSAKSYRVVEVEIPADLKGLTVELEATLDLGFAGDASATPVGTPVNHGTTEVRTYLITPAIEDSGKAFWRLKVTR
ncbi:hypothetical protein [Haloferula sargassicola]|uniref:Cadherin domain-containing protein n=1 Tax=Haloferula sargassicola TaxID=490096 RepID=A0ABP9UV40_9BACT